MAGKSDVGHERRSFYRADMQTRFLFNQTGLNECGCNGNWEAPRLVRKANEISKPQWRRRNSYRQWPCCSCVFFSEQTTHTRQAQPQSQERNTEDYHNGPSGEYNSEGELLFSPVCFSWLVCWLVHFGVSRIANQLPQHTISSNSRRSSTTATVTIVVVVVVVAVVVVVIMSASQEASRAATAEIEPMSIPGLQYLNEQAIGAMKRNRIDDMIATLKLAARVVVRMNGPARPRDSPDTVATLPQLQLEPVPSFYKPPGRILCKFVSVVPMVSMEDKNVTGRDSTSVGKAQMSIGNGSDSNNTSPVNIGDSAVVGSQPLSASVGDSSSDGPTIPTKQSHPDATDNHNNNNNNKSQTLPSHYSSVAIPLELLAFVVVYNLALAFHLSGSLVAERHSHWHSAKELYRMAHRMLQSTVRMETPLLSVLLLCNLIGILQQQQTIGFDNDGKELLACLQELRIIVGTMTTVPSFMSTGDRAGPPKSSVSASSVMNGLDAKDIRVIRRLLSNSRIVAGGEATNPPQPLEGPVSATTMTSGDGSESSKSTTGSLPSSVTVTDDSSTESMSTKRKRKATGDESTNCADCVVAGGGASGTATVNHTTNDNDAPMDTSDAKTNISPPLKRVRP